MFTFVDQPILKICDGEVETLHEHTQIRFAHRMLTGKLQDELPLLQRLNLPFDPSEQGQSAKRLRKPKVWREIKSDPDEKTNRGRNPNGCRSRQAAHRQALFH